MDCLFCKIARKEIPAEVVYEDEAAMAIADIHPRAPGHVFVIPKQHCANFTEMPDELIAPVFAAVKKTAMLLKDKVKADGMTIGINQGRASGQEVDHLHIHILPRFMGDGGGSIQSVVDSVGGKFKI